MLGVDRRMALAGIPFLYGRATQHAEWKQATAQVHSFVDKYIDRALTEQAMEKATARMEGAEKPGIGGSSSINMKLKSLPFSVLSELVNETTDRKFLRDQLISLFFPSRDATGIGLSGLFFNLARHPHVWTTVREEVMASSGPDGPLTFEKLKSMKYLQSVLNESTYESPQSISKWQRIAPPTKCFLSPIYTEQS